MCTEREKKNPRENPNEILIRCLHNDDFTEWNEWRKNESNEWRYHNKRGYISLKSANLGNVNLVGADLSKANLEKVDLNGVNLAGADLSEANLAGADLSHVNLIDVDLWKTDMKFANLWETNLKNAQLKKANLENAQLVKVNLEGADLWKANLKGAKFISVLVDKRTFIWGCDFDEQTVFSGGGLSKARIEPRLIEHIRKNIPTAASTAPRSAPCSN